MIIKFTHKADQPSILYTLDTAKGYVIWVNPYGAVCKSPESRKLKHLKADSDVTIIELTK